MTVSNPVSSPRRRRQVSAVIAGVVFIASYFVAVHTLNVVELAPTARWAVALLPVAPCAWFVFSEVSLIAGLDELQRRIHLEALAIGFPVAIVLAMAFGLLQKEGLMPRAFNDLRDVWALLPWPYFFALWFVKRRYR